MRIGSFERNGAAGYGVFKDDGIVDLGLRLGGQYPDLLALLRGGALAEAAAAAEGQAADFGIDEISFTPLIPAPVNIFCAGINYLDHIEETGRERPKFPTVFMKLQQSVVGHDEPILKPLASDIFDYEAELAVVIGKTGRRIAKDDWRDHVAGYTCLMDGSVRDYQGRSTDQGKNFYQSSSCGPWMVTMDEVPADEDMRIQARLNGKVMQDSTIDQLCFDVCDLVTYYSEIVQLAPGDIISTGTPGGVGHRREPPVYMKDGDTIEVDIAGVGVLRNPIVNE